MTYDQCKSGTYVIDQYFPEWGAGEIVRVFDKVIWVMFEEECDDGTVSDRLEVYAITDIRFLDVKED